MALSTMPQRVIIVRHEDIVSKPKEIVDELARLGLPRNEKPFEVIQDSITTRGETRAHISQQDKAAWNRPDHQKMLQKLSTQGHNLRRLLEYVIDL